MSEIVHSYNPNKVCMTNAVKPIRKKFVYLLCLNHAESGICGDDFTCEDGTCLPYNRVCDRYGDCSDMSDEQRGCGE